MASNAGKDRRKSKGPTMKCSLCVHTDHQFSSTKKCPYYRGNKMGRSSTTECLQTREGMGVETDIEDAANNNKKTRENKKMEQKKTKQKRIKQKKIMK
eukprot:8938329-Ditylum_brightwellii.AAC.1